MKLIPAVNQRLRMAIDRAGISQRQLALKLGLNPTSISHVVSGRSFLQFDLARQACEILDISMDWLAWGTSTNKGEDLLAQLDATGTASKEARLEYMIAIVRQMDQASQDEVFDFTIIELDKKIRTVIDRRSQTATISEEAK
ncbi:MAG: helix-turn-helix domain-containing protein [Spirochaetia bacterium]